MGKAAMLVSSRKYIKPAVYIMLGTFIINILLLLLGQYPRALLGNGKVIASDDEVLSAAFTFSATCGLPIIFILFWFMSRDNWKKLDKQKTYNFQGGIVVYLLALWSIITIIWIITSVFIADYPGESKQQNTATHESKDAQMVLVGEDPSKTIDKQKSQWIEKKSLSEQVQTLCTRLGWLLTLILSFELFYRKAESSA